MRAASAVYRNGNQPRLSSAYTLVEALIVVIIFVVAGGVIISLFIGQNSLYHFYKAEVESGGNARLALDRMVNVSREADAVLSSRDFGGTVYYSDNDTLILRLRAVSSANEIIPGSFDYFVFFLDSLSQNKLMEKSESCPQSKRTSVLRVLSETVDELNFSYNTTNFDTINEIDFMIDTREDFRGSTATTTLYAKTKLRNK